MATRSTDTTVSDLCRAAKSTPNDATKGPEMSDPEEQAAQQAKKRDAVRHIELQARPIPWRLKRPVAQFVINVLLQLAAIAAAIGFGVFAIKSVNLTKEANVFAKQQYSSDSQQAAQDESASQDTSRNTKEAVDQARMSNQLTLLTICLSLNNNSSNIGQSCEGVIRVGGSLLRDIASKLFSDYPDYYRTTSTPSHIPSPTSIVPITTETTTTTYSSTPQPIPAADSSSSKTSRGVVIGIAAGVPIGVLILGGIAFICFRRKIWRNIGVHGPTSGHIPRPHLRPIRSDQQSMVFSRWFRKAFIDWEVVPDEPTAGSRR